MGKKDKKRKKLEERIEFLELELISALSNKDSSLKEIDIAGHTRKLEELRNKLANLK